MTHALFLLHGVVLFVGIGNFCAAFVCGLLYLVEQHELKTKRFGQFFKVLPPLETLDRLAVGVLRIGFVSLTAGLVIGIYMAHKVWSQNWVRDPTVLFSILTWGWYLILLLVRYRSGWRGSRFFALIVIGFLFLLFTYFGVPLFFPKTLHQYLVVWKWDLSWI